VGAKEKQTRPAKIDACRATNKHHSFENARQSALQLLHPSNISLKLVLRTSTTPPPLFGASCCTFCISPSRFFLVGLPLGLLALEESLENADNLLQGGEIVLKLRVHLLLIIAKLGIKIFAVWASAHGGAENGLDNKAVVGLKSGAVRAAERVGEFFGGGYVLAEAKACEFEPSVRRQWFSTLSNFFLPCVRLHSPDQPDQPLCCFVALRLELVSHEILQVLRLDGSGKLARADFLQNDNV